jgi:phosphoribosylanthranilate isomerase
MLESGAIQVAGVIDEDEVALLVECGVRQIGFPLRLPVHAEDLHEEEAARIIRRLPLAVSAVLITYLDEAAAIDAFARTMGVHIVQLHGDVDRRQLEILKTLAPDLVIIKSLVVGRHDPGALEALAVSLSPLVDAFITDTFDPHTGASGATGCTHDWAVSRRLVAASARPVILAGGLTPDNVGQAILAVDPAAVDVHTGVEDRHGRKDRAKVAAFVRAARQAFTRRRS